MGVDLIRFHHFESGKSPTSRFKSQTPADFCAGYV